jgi:hypothetical protein
METRSAFPVVAVIWGLVSPARAMPRRRRTSSMDNRIPVVVRMQVECAMCGYAEDDTYGSDQ